MRLFLLQLLIEFVRFVCLLVVLHLILLQCVLILCDFGLQSSQAFICLALSLYLLSLGILKSLFQLLLWFVFVSFVGVNDNLGFLKLHMKILKLSLKSLFCTCHLTFKLDSTCFELITLLPEVLIEHIELFRLFPRCLKGSCSQQLIHLTSIAATASFGIRALGLQLLVTCN